MWVPPESVHFLTVCSAPRGTNQLCHPYIADVLFESLGHYEHLQRWRVYACVLMPDHVHLLTSGAEPASVITPWKRYTARHLGIRWQREFFEHRLRRDESFDEKVEYLRNNPVRAGLVASADEWPYVRVVLARSG